MCTRQDAFFKAFGYFDTDYFPVGILCRQGICIQEWTAVQIIVYPVNERVMLVAGVNYQSFKSRLPTVPS